MFEFITPHQSTICEYNSVYCVVADHYSTIITCVVIHSCLRSSDGSSCEQLVNSQVNNSQSTFIFITESS